MKKSTVSGDFGVLLEKKDDLQLIKEIIREVMNVQMVFALKI